MSRSVDQSGINGPRMRVNLEVTKNGVPVFSTANQQSSQAETMISNLLMPKGTKAPELTGNQAWINSAPLTLAMSESDLYRKQRLAIEEVAHQLGELSAAAWIERGDTNRVQYGFTTNAYRVSVELKDGAKLNVEFGGMKPPGFPYALTMVDEQPWIFIFPWPLYYQYVKEYLSIPAYIP